MGPKKLVLAPLLMKLFVVAVVAGAATTAGVVGSRAADSSQDAPAPAARAVSFDSGPGTHVLAAEENAQDDADQAPATQDPGAANDQRAAEEEDQGDVGNEDEGEVEDVDEGEVEDVDDGEVEDEDEDEGEVEDEDEGEVEDEGEESDVGSDD